MTVHDERRLRLRGAEVDLATREVRRPDGDLRLTRREAELLAYLAERAGRVVGRDELLREVWGFRPGVRTRTVEATVHTLRSKIEREPRRPEHVLTERGDGYRFVPPGPGDSLPYEVALDPEARRAVWWIRGEALGYDDPEAGLAAMPADAGSDEVDARRAELLVALGRLAEAEAALATIGAGPRRDLVAADLARRLGHPVEALLRSAATGEGEVGARARVRLGVWCLDQGRIDEGFAWLAEAERWCAEAGAARLRALAAGEIGMYRLLQGRPVEALVALDRSARSAETARSAYVSRVTHLARALALTWLERPAHAERDAAERLRPARMEEPGVYAIVAMERRLAGADPVPALRAGLARHAARPNQADHRLIVGLAAPLGLCPPLSPGPDLPWALAEAARGAPERAAALGVVLDPRLLGMFLDPPG